MLVRPTVVPVVTHVPSPAATTAALPSAPAVTRSSRPSPVSTTWNDAWQGWRITTRRDVARPVAGQLVRFVVTLTPPRTGSGGLTVLWGDNTGDANPSPGCSNATFTAGKPLTVALSHAWRVGRRYAVTLQPTVGCAGGPATSFPRHSLDVGSGPLRGNGPLTPWGSMDYGPSETGLSGDPTYLTVRGTDGDGYVSELVLDWGDGSAVTVLRNPNGCHRPPDDAWIQSSFAVDDVKHQYADSAGSHVVVLTVVSSGCRGEDVQRHSYSWRPSGDGPSGPMQSPPPAP